MFGNNSTIREPGATVPEGIETVYENGAATITQAALTDATRRGSAVVENLAIQKGMSLLETYRVESDAIEGGMGSVWRVRHTGWNVDLAMKRPQPQCFSTEKSKADFIHECEAWINLGLHPNIVSCYYVREIGGTPTIFSEWMNGGSLENAVKSGALYQGTQSQQQERILDIAIQFARGLHYAHEAGLIHQDVKPDNLLLTKEGDAKVADFGLARARAVLTVRESAAAAQNAAESGKTILSPSGGYTPAYCSMEQMDGRELTRRTDIYSWAVSVMELYLGSCPWANGVVAGLNCRDYFKKSGLPIPKPLQKLLAQCMKSKPEKRPYDFMEVEASLHEIYKTETSKEYPRSAPKAAADTADSLNNRALSYLDLGKPTEAERCWSDALTFDKAHPAAQYNRILRNWRLARATDLTMRVFIEKLERAEAAGDEVVQWMNDQCAAESGRAEVVRCEELEEGCKNVVITADGSRTVYCNPQGTMVVRDRTGGKFSERKLTCFQCAKENRMWQRTVLSPNGKYAVSAAADERFDLLSLDSDEIVAALEFDVDHATIEMHFSPDGSALFVFEDEKILRFGLSGEKEFEICHSDRHSHAFCVSADGTRILAYEDGSDHKLPDGTWHCGIGRYMLAQYDARTGSELARTEISFPKALHDKRKEESSVFATCCIPDERGNLLIAAHFHAIHCVKVLRLNLSDGSIKDILDAPEWNTDRMLDSLSLSRDGTRLLVCSAPQFFYWTLDPVRCLHTFLLQDWRGCAMFDNGGENILACGQRHALMQWEAPQWERKADYLLCGIRTASEQLQSGDRFSIRMTQAQEQLKSEHVEESILLVKEIMQIGGYENHPRLLAFLEEQMRYCRRVGKPAITERIQPYRMPKDTFLFERQTIDSFGGTVNWSSPRSLDPDEKEVRFTWDGSTRLSFQSRPLYDHKDNAVVSVTDSRGKIENFDLAATLIVQQMPRATFGGPRPAPRTIEYQDKRIIDLCAMPDGRHVAVLKARGSVQIFSLTGGVSEKKRPYLLQDSKLAILPPPSVPGERPKQYPEITNCRLFASPDGEFLLVTTNNGRDTRLDSIGGGPSYGGYLHADYVVQTELIRVDKEGSMKHMEIPACFGSGCFLPDGKRLLLADDFEGKVWLVDLCGDGVRALHVPLAKGEASETIVGGRTCVTSTTPNPTLLCAGADGRYACIAQGKTCYLWSLESDCELRRIDAKRNIGALAINADDTLLALDDAHYTLRWDVEFPGWSTDTEVAEPYLHAFLRRCPDWDTPKKQLERDAFLRELQCRGLGYLRPNAIIHALRNLKNDGDTAHSEESGR
ncbi:MAG: serine/threonine-protein kinase [Eubacteriales bacterium]|nr:serine/threonine-protein kinase [Eubacteriales bacterium]